MATCQVCGSELQGSICPLCIQRQKGEEIPRNEDGDGDGYEEPGMGSGQSDDEDFDPLPRVASEQTLAERLLGDLGAILPDRDHKIAEYLVGSLDEKGYLTCSVEEAAYELDVDLARVRAVLKTLQTQEPVGIGARNLRECLLIQIDYLAQEGITEPHARDVVADYLVELGEHKFGKIAHDLQISSEAVASVWEFVKTRLNPHPAHGFSSTNARDRDTRQMYILPDVIITRGDQGFDIEVVESKRFLLRINPMYSRLNARLQRESADLSTDERKHIQQYVGRAKLFIANINQRRQTLMNITRALADKQHDFLDHGVRHLRPLSRAAIALELGVHESTVSRATAQKYVMTPDGEIIPYAHFFTPSLSIKDVIKEMVERERRPLTDAQIASRLEQMGINIARRTVAKYRMQLDILPSGLR
ncbi:MAG: RNA polymerase factor sigma-54 [Chloroflexi bacterium]|nr:RNA polymerase factor sigma-54 [Chloroflexota bacterium]